MSFKVGKFYAIQAKTATGMVIYLEANPNAHSDKLRRIARKAARGYNTWEDEEDYEDRSAVQSSDNPFDLKLYSIDTDIEIMTGYMRQVRKYGANICDVTTVKLVVVETQVSGFNPESDTKEAIALRKFALEKLSDEEKALLNLGHWDVYNKLADRTGLDDDETPF